MNWIKVVILSLSLFKVAPSEIGQKIIGGEDAIQGQFPYQVMTIIKITSTQQVKHWPLAFVPCSTDEYKGLAMSANHGLLLTAE